MGPIGLLLYVLTDKGPAPGTHEEFVKPLWKQGVGSTVHCIAGNATGIIAAAVVTATLGLPMWIDLIVEYVAGIAFGLFVIQALFMKDMMGGTYLRALRRSFVPEWLSMNMMMAGMAPTMIFLMMGRDMRAMQPTEPVFWLVMSLGVVVGFAVAYPVDVWMVARNLKHGLMTVRPVRPRPPTRATSPHRLTPATPALTPVTGHRRVAGRPCPSSPDRSWPRWPWSPRWRYLPRRYGRRARSTSGSARMWAAW